MREWAKNLLFRVSDRLCAYGAAGVHPDPAHAHPWVFELGNWAGELGWKLRRAA